MTKNLYFRLLCVLVIFGCARLLSAQDIHFSQFYNAPLTLSPALTGMHGGDLRLMGNYRSQWNAANAPYKTFMAVADKKFYNVEHDDWWLSGGGWLFHDKAGDGELATTQFALTGSYTKKLDAENFLSIGVSGGLTYRGFEFANYTFDNQWNGDVYDPNRDTQEDFSDQNIMYSDFGIGFNWRGQQTKKRSKLDIGAGAYHFNRPNQSYQSSDKSQLSTRLSMYFMPTVQVAEKMDIVGNLTGQVQSKYLEALGTAAGRYHLSTAKAKGVAVQFGIGYRFNAIGDAMVMAGEFHYHDWMVGLSWDLNVSGFSVATNRNGGPELAIRYIIHKVYPVRAFKACPLI